MSLPALDRRLVVALLTAALLLPFVGKAFHVDDTLFLAAAERIGTAPLAPYEFDYNWFGRPRPMWEVTQNPPLNSYLLAAVGLGAGKLEVVYHLVYLAIAVAAALLMFALARRWCRHALTAVALTIVGPVFLVSATNVMAEIPMLALWLLAVLTTVRAAEDDTPARLWWAGLAASGAAMTKYFGAALVPLLVVYWVHRKRHITAHLTALALPLVVLIAWGLYAKSAGGVFHPLGAAGYAVEVSGKLSNRASHAGNALAFLGGALLWPVLALPLLVRERWRAAAPLGIVTAVAAIALWNTLPAGVRTLWIAMFAGGGAVLVLGVASWRRRTDPDSTLLALWLVGTVVFAMFLNWTVAARTLLPAAFPAAVLFVRWLEATDAPRPWLRYSGAIALPVMAVSLLLALADRAMANASREFVRTEVAAVVREVRGSGATRRITFLGHWGFQHYMERAGIVAHDIRDTPRPGDLIVVAHNNSNVAAIHRIPSVPRVDRLVPSSFLLHTINTLSHAGFYTTLGGPVPFAPAGDWPTDRLVVYEVVGPGSRGSPQHP